MNGEQLFALRFSLFAFGCWLFAET